ncbi:MAG: hypothetical protein ACJAXQ_001866 [Parvibaculaceae bacterium]|jgi:uncharacterized protein (DUF983 family)|tara:strand:- start:215 stop:595 length:381 start_codon:yes stop_codon:yes gene_type:complete
MCRCPNCGTGNIFKSYLKVVDHCDTCGEELLHQRADDAPPYLTIMLVGHIIIPAMLVVEKMYQPELWVHSVIWLPLTLILSLIFLPLLKGSVVGLQWAVRMHGFDITKKLDNVEVMDAPQLTERPA